MEDNDKRNSSVPEGDSEPSSSVPPAENAPQSQSQSQTPAQAQGPQGPQGPQAQGQAGESDLYDAHEATLPRFTIDPGDAFPSRQRTRTLLGVPTLVGDDEASRESEPPTTLQSRPSSGKLSSAILDAGDRDESHEALDITVDVDMDDDDDSADVTIVSDADVVSLADTTGQLRPVQLDEADPSGQGSQGAAAPAADGSGNGLGEPSSKQAPPEISVTLPAAEFAADPSATPAATGKGASASTNPANPSSLAPREVARPRTQPRPASDASGRWGALLVAAVLLLATGAWFLTAGTFRRATVTELPAPPSTATVAQPANPMAKPEPNPPSEAPTATVAEVTDDSTGKEASADDAAKTALKNKPSLTATVRNERVRHHHRASKKATSVAPAPGTGELPQGPTRAEVISRLESVRPAVRACAAGRSGVADLDITIAHTGVVIHVLVGGDFAGTTEGSCIARAVRHARFPAFKQERFRLLYPYAI